jgi:tetratricopeptide (TPR) repeat protein
VNWFKSDDEETTAKPKKTKSQISWRSNTPVPTTPLPSLKPLASASTNAVKVASVLPSAVAFPRYKYLNPALPNSGDRQVAKTYFDDGDGAQKREEWQRAKAAYLEAAKADPAWFDARFELGQAAYYTGDTDLALQSFEHALAIDPNDGPARFNFAMSLVQGNYYAAAARELETFLQFDPDNAQAHFEAGRLYAQKLNDVARAAVHYKRVIGLKPGHPQAVTIRYWLIRNKTN